MTRRQLETFQERQERTRAAREAGIYNAAVRATEDPVRLAKAARIVRVALERKRLRLADLTGDDGDQAGVA